MRFSNLKNSIYIKYLFSYIAILSIPIFIITLILSKTVFSILEKEIISRDEISSVYSSYTLNSDFLNLNRICESMATEDNIKPVKLNENITASINIINSLKRYTLSNNFCDKIFIHFFNDEFVYSDSSSYTLENFYKLVGSNENIDTSLSNILTNLNTSQIISDLEDNKLYYAFPYTLNNNVVGSVLFSIDLKKLNLILNNTAHNNYNFLIDKNLNIINLSEIESLDNSNLANYLKRKLDYFNSDSFVIDNIDDYTIFFSEIPSINLFLLSVKSSDYLYRDLSKASFLFILASLLALTLGSIAIYFFIKKNYEPIKELKSFSENLKIANSDIYYCNEIDVIKNTINYLNERNLELEDTISKSLPINQDFMLKELINGNISNNNKFLNDCLKIGLNLSSPYHAIIAIKSDNTSTPHSIMTLFKEYNIQNFSIDYEFLVNSIENNLTLFLVGLKDKNLFINDIKKVNDTMTFSIGSIQKDLNLISKSYIDSLTNLEMPKNIENSESIKEFIKKYDDILKNVYSILYNDSFEELYYIIFSVTSLLKKETLPFKIIRNVYFELILMFNTYIDKNKKILNYHTIDLATLYEIHSKEALNDVFIEIFNELFPLIKNKNNLQTPKLSIEKIKENIIQNYTDYSFSLQLLSDKFGISPSYLSQYFKDKTGITILDYITTLKINKAKDLLRNSDLALKDIAKQIGYSNVSSFIRRFKQVTKTTPGEYKKSIVKS